jgi:hypothetical protein
MLMEQSKLEEIILAWQEWWNTIGFEWYSDGEFPQSQRPPFLKSEHPLFGCWLPRSEHESKLEE